MKRRIIQWHFFSWILCVLLLAGALLFQQAATSIAESLLEPWFAICRTITPVAWQTTGNALLGLLWLLSGIVVYSMLIGALGVVGWTIADRMRKAGKTPRVSGKTKKTGESYS